jgi:hypothetical protein
MIHGMMEDAVSPPHAGIPLWPKDRTILEREVMEFRPFGLDEQGHAIRDLSGMSIRAVVVYLEKSLALERGASAGSQAVEDLCHLLNQRIKDPVYHVTPEFLKNAWNSYTYEFTAYLYEFCERMSGDPRFVFRGGMEKASSIMQVLARPFSLSQIYGNEVFRPYPASVWPVSKTVRAADVSGCSRHYGGGTGSRPWPAAGHSDGPILYCE